ncbi:MAG: alpha-2-macroglobulin family protein [Candidatus Hydrogenedens sp.]
MKTAPFTQMLVMTIVVLFVISCGGGDVNKGEGTKEIVSQSQNVAKEVPKIPTQEENFLVPISQYPLPGDAIEKKFILFFDKNVHFPPEVPIDEYVKTEPPLKGITDCVENKIVFNILQAIPKNVDEVVFHIHPELQSEEGIKINPQNLSYRVPVEEVQVVEGNFSEVGEDYFIFSLDFNHYVIGDDIKHFISLKDQNNADVEFDVKSPGQFINTINLHVKWTGTESYKLLIKPGYTDYRKKYKGQGAYFEFPIKDTLEVVECKKKSNMGYQIVFSRPVSSKAIYKCLRIASSTQNNIPYYVIPADVRVVQEIAIDLPQNLEQIGEGKISKAWIINLKNPSFPMYSVSIELRKSTWSNDMALLPEEYRWETKVKEDGGFSIYYSYWKSNGLDGVSCFLNMTKVNKETFMKYFEVIPPVDNLSIKDSQWNEVEIKGDWKTGVKYLLKFKAGLQWGENSGTDENPKYMLLERDYAYTMKDVPQFKTLDFDNKDKFYIIPFHEKNYIRVGSRNVSKGYIHIYQVMPENLSIWLGNVSENTVPFEINERTSKYLTSIPVEFPNSVDRASFIDVDITQYLSDVPKGIFTLCLSDNSNPGRLRASWEPKKQEEESQLENYGYEWEDRGDSYYYPYGGSNDGDSFYQDVKGTRSAIRYILWTRLGVVSHWDDASLMAFVHDLIDLTPQMGAVVSAYSIKNLKVVEGVSDNNGIVKLILGKQDLGTPRLLTVRTDKDFSFVLLKPKELPTLKELEKYDSFEKDRYEAFIYTDRNLYRPGELIHSRWVVRKNYGADIINAPLELRFINPQKKVVHRKIVNLSEWGTGGEDIITEFTYLTGAYTLGLYVPGGELLCGSIPIYIEDFVPDRIKNEITVPNKFWIVGDEQSFEVSSQYYVGPPAVDLPSKGKLIITPTEFEHENWKGYRFGNDEILKTVVMDLGVQKTNEEGKSNFSFNFSPPGPINKPIEISIVSEVSEAGGRAVSAVKKVKGYPESVLCGLGVEKVEDKLQVVVALVDKDFAPALDEEVIVYLEKVEWRYVNRYYSGSSRNTFPQWDRYFTLIEQKKVTTSGGKATVYLNIPQYYSTYRIRAQRTNGKVFSEVSFYSVPGKMINLKGGPPELVKIHIEDKKWLAGEKVPVNIEVPFDGKAVAVIQGDKVWDMQVLDIISGKGSFSFEVKEEYFPNVWVGVSALHVPTKEETISPYSTFSFAKVDIEKPTRKMNVEILNVPEEVKPQNTIEIGVKTTDNNGNPVASELTVALVDEGIHSILGYTLPNPYEWFGRSRYSPIRRVHYYDHVAYGYDPLSPSGDMIARQLSAGKPEISESWIKPLALWSGSVKTDEQGQVKVSFNLPEFNGTVRLVAVGANKELVGSSETKMFVRRPCVIQTHLPRFLRPNDRAIIFGRGLNAQDNPLDINLSLTHNDVVDIEPSQIHWEAVPKNLSLSPEIVLSCLTGTKNAELNWQYNIVDKTGNIIDEYSEHTVIPVHLPSIYEQRVKSYVVPIGGNLQLDTSEFVNNPLLETEIKIGSTPFLRIEPALKWLRTYDYCCCEQKISRLYPLYIFRNFLKESMEDVISKENYDQLLLTMVDSLFAHQQANGGFSLWPYSNSTDIKASLHVAFLLTMINRDKTLPLPEKLYQRVLAFLQDVCSEENTEDSVNDQFKAYASLILALNGDPSACERVNNMLKADYPRNLKVLLLLTADICGVPREELKKYVQLLQWETSVENQICPWEYGSSEVREYALKLISKVIADEPLDSIHETQKPLMDYISNYTGYTTYNLSMILLALDISFKKMNIQPFEYQTEIKIDDNVQTLKGTKLLKRKKQGPTNIEINNQGNSPLFVYWTIRGISNNPPKDAQSKNIELQRILYNARNKTNMESPYLQGSVYVMEYQIKPQKDAQNLILTQLLPAGFEIENPRLKQEQISDIFSSISKEPVNTITPEHIEIRDDKLIVALPSLSSRNKYSYVCAIRAVTKGSFEFPGAYIEDMYEPETFACLATTQIEIK